MKQEIEFLSLRRQHEMLRSQLHEAINEVIDRGCFILGDEVRQLEEEFATYCGVRFGVGVASGTEAIAIALMALDISQGDEVVTVPNISAPTVCAILMAGATPVLVDVDPVSRNMDPARLPEAVTSRTKAIVPVHLYGLPADMVAISAEAAQRGIPVVEDAAQAHGATLDDSRVGSLGAMSCFSFYPTKNLGAIGDAGMIVTDNPDLAERARAMREYGQRKRYYNELDGINSRLDELQAAVLRTKHKYLDDWNARRREIAGYYRSELSDLDLRLPSEPEGATHVYHLFVVEVSDRGRFREQCSRRGVQTGIHYPRPIHLQPAFRRLGYGPGAFPHAEALCGRVVSLPLYPELTDAEVEAVGAAVRIASARRHRASRS